MYIVIKSYLNRRNAYITATEKQALEKMAELSKKEFDKIICLNMAGREEDELCCKKTKSY